jgi:hypothetical protein
MTERTHLQPLAANGSAVSESAGVGESGSRV